MSTSFRLRRGRLIVLPVRLRHRAEVSRRMLLDTGARVTIVRLRLAEELGLNLQEDPEAELIGVAGSGSVSEATIDTVSMLGYVVRNVAVVCHPLHPALAFDGVLGMNLVEHFNVWIDNDAERVTLELRLE